MELKPVNSINNDANTIRVSDGNSPIRLIFKDVKGEVINLYDKIDYFYLTKDDEKYYSVTDISYDGDEVIIRLPKLRKGQYKAEIRDKDGSIYPANEDLYILLRRSFEDDKDIYYFGHREDILNNVEPIIIQHIEENPDKFRGERGQQGFPGRDGLKGVKGDKGNKGDKGEQGIKGIQGIKGDKGDKGDKGNSFLEEEVINLNSYPNVKGDGISFDTEYIQHAVDNYKVVLIPYTSKFYRIDKKINVPNDTHIIGIGTPKIYNDTATAEPIFNIVDSYNVKFNNLNIQNGIASADKPIKNKDGFYFYNSRNIEISECYINNIQGQYGMSFEKCDGILIKNNLSYKISKGHCLLWGEVSNILIEGNTFDTVTNASIGAGSNYTYLLATAHHSANGEPNFLVKNLTVRHNTFKNNPMWEGIDCHGGVNVVFEYNDIENVHTGIMLSYLAGNFEKNPKHENITIRHNNIKKGNGDPGGFGIVSGGGYDAGEYIRAKNIEITHNKINGMGRPESLEDGAISISNVEHFNISNNLIEKYDGVGICTKSDCSYGVISHNTIKSPNVFGLKAISLRYYGMFIKVISNNITGEYGHSLHGAGIRFSTPGLYDIKDNIYMFVSEKYEISSRSQLEKENIASLNSTLSHESIPAYNSNGIVKFKSTDKLIRGLNGLPIINTSVSGDINTKTLRLSGSGNLFHFFEGMEVVIPNGGIDGVDLITHIRLRTNDTITIQDKLESTVTDVIPYLSKGNWIEI